MLLILTDVQLHTIPALYTTAVPSHMLLILTAVQLHILSALYTTAVPSHMLLILTAVQLHILPALYTTAVYFSPINPAVPALYTSCSQPHVADTDSCVAAVFTLLLAKILHTETKVMLTSLLLCLYNAVTALILNIGTVRTEVLTSRLGRFSPGKTQSVY